MLLYFTAFRFADLAVGVVEHCDSTVIALRPSQRPSGLGQESPQEGVQGDELCFSGAGERRNSLTSWAARLVMEPAGDFLKQTCALLRAKNEAVVAINKVFLAISSVQLLERIQSVFTKPQNEVTPAMEKNLKLLFWLKLNFYFLFLRE